jgi:hypothetical protein
LAEAMSRYEQLVAVPASAPLGNSRLTTDAGMTPDGARR